MRPLSFVVVLVSLGAACGAWYSERVTRGWSVSAAQESCVIPNVDLVIEQRKHFIPFVEARLEDILYARLSLAQASAIVLSHAEEHFPRFARFLELEPGVNLQHKMACNLVRSFKHHGPWGTPWLEDVSFRTRLEAELVEIAAEE